MDLEHGQSVQNVENTENVESAALSVYQRKFAEWLCSSVKLGQYLSLFRKNECDDVRMIEFFEERVLESELGIKRTFHRKLILKKSGRSNFLRNASSNRSWALSVRFTESSF